MIRYIASFVVLLVATSFVAVPFTDSAESESILLKPVTLVEDFYSIDFWNEDLLTSIMQDRDLFEFFKVNMPLHPIDPDVRDKCSLTDNQARYTYERVTYFPWMVVNGVVKENIDNSNENINRLIIDGIENNKQYASFYMNVCDKNTLKITVKGEHGALKEYSALSLNVILIEDWINCDFSFQKWILEHKTTRRNIVRDYPLTPHGKEINLYKDQQLTETILVTIPERTANKYIVLALLQDPITKEILATGVTPLSKHKVPAYFNWNHWPKCIHPTSLGEIPDPDSMDYVQKTGLSEMSFSVQNAVDLKSLSMKISKNEVNYFEILGAVPVITNNLESFSFDLETSEVKMQFKEPLNGNFELFNYIVHYIKYDLYSSCSFQIQDFYALDSNKNSVYFSVNDIIRRHPNRMIVTKEPCDFNDDKWINDLDYQLITNAFGLKKGDIGYDRRYDLCKEGNSRSRIDFSDLFVFNAIHKEQKRLTALIETT